LASLADARGHVEPLVVSTLARDDALVVVVERGDEPKRRGRKP